jgi:hypothetical protein
MVDMNEVLYQAVEGLAGSITQALIDFYQIKRDRPGSAQYDLELRRDNAALDREYKLRHDLSVWETALRVHGDLALARATDQRDLNPFGKRSEEDVVSSVRADTRDGGRPVLLLAPFLRIGEPMQASMERTHDYIRPLRESWRKSAWRTDMEVNMGLIGRPLVHTDEDLRNIRAVLAAFPVILINGVITSGKIGLEILAWNIVGGPSYRSGETPCFEITLSERIATATAPGELPGQLPDGATQLCAMLAEWFYVTRGRPPRRHRDIAAGLRRPTAEGSLAALDSVTERQGLDPAKAASYRALIHADLGAMEPLRGALADVQRQTSPDKAVELLQKLRQAFPPALTLGISPLTAEAIQLIDDELANASVRFNRSKHYG